MTRMTCSDEWKNWILMQYVNTSKLSMIDGFILCSKNSIVVLGQAINDIEVWFDRGVLHDRYLHVSCMSRDEHGESV